MTGIQNSECSFFKQLQLLRSAEQMLTKAMPGMIDKTTNFGLKKSLAFHLAETHQHKTALDGICKHLDVDARGKMNEEIKSIIEQGEQQMSEEKEGEALDAVIIKAALKIEQYEIEEYEKAAQYAIQSGYVAIAGRLFLTQQEEKQAETKLKFVKKGLPEQKRQPASVQDFKN
jgi:ferritin-like metal-binding protein YciE